MNLPFPPGRAHPEDDSEPLRVSVGTDKPPTAEEVQVHPQEILQQTARHQKRQKSGRWAAAGLPGDAQYLVVLALNRGFQTPKS